MERFLVRGYEEKGRKRTQRMRQTRITDAEKVVVEERVKHLNQQLNDAQDEDTLRNVLNVLETQFISLEMMEKTLIGVSLTRVQRRVESDILKERVNKLLKVWKRRAIIALRRRERKQLVFGRNTVD